MHRPEQLPDSHICSQSILHLSDNVKGCCAYLLAKTASNSSVSEVMAAPKPGLVDPLGPGCHTDMDYKMFLRSADAISPYWIKQALIGLEGTSPGMAMADMRRTGLEMERAMFTATGGINTHKGLIYLMSLLLYGAGFCIFKERQLSPDKIAEYASSAVAGIVERDLVPLKNTANQRELTHGEKLYLSYGVTGVRGEAERGFPSVINHGLPELARAAASGASRNNALISALLAIMESNEDSNVIHRGGYTFWKETYRGMVSRARSNFDPLSDDYSALEELEKEFIPLGISPGGAADLLSCTAFIYDLTLPLVNNSFLMYPCITQ